MNSVVSLPFAWQGILLTLSGALLRALYILYSKRVLVRYSSRFVIVFNMLGSSLVLFTIMLIFARPQITDWSSWPTGVLWPLIITGVLNVFIQSLEMRALEIEQASLVAPMSAAAPLFAVFTGLVILRELPTVWGWIGVILISVGSYILTLKERPVGLGAAGHAAELLFPFKALAKSRGVRLALLVAFLGSISINFDKIVVLQSGRWFLPATMTGFVGLIMLLTLGKEHWPKNLTLKNILALAVPPLLFSGAVVLFVSAFSFGFASHSSALRRVSILFVALLAGTLIGEKRHPERIIGSLIITIGAILLAF